MANARIRIKGFENEKKIITTRLLGEIKKAELLNAIGEDVINDVRNEAQEGQNTWPSISPAWEKRKKRLAEFNPTHSEYAPGRNNLTFTGQLLNSLKTFLIVGKAQIIIRPTKKHKRYRGVKGKLLGSRNVDNDKIADGLISQGRDFMKVSKETLVKVSDTIRKFLSRKFLTKP